MMQSPLAEDSLCAGVEEQACLRAPYVAFCACGHMRLICLQRVHQALESGGEVQEERSWAGPSEEDPTYRLLVDCNQLAVDIDNEIAIVHIFMRDKYK